MLPDFLGMVEMVFCWVFCKKRWLECGFKRGEGGLVVVDLWLGFTRVASLPLGKTNTGVLRFAQNDNSISKSNEQKQIPFGDDKQERQRQRQRQRQRRPQRQRQEQQQRQMQWLGGVEGGFYGGVYFGVGEFGGYTDAVHDRFLVGGAVAYDADSADA